MRTISIAMDVTRLMRRRPMSGLLRVAARLRAGLAARAEEGVGEVAWDAEREDFAEVSEVPRVGGAVLTTDIFDEVDRPGWGEALERRRLRAVAVFHDAIPVRHPAWCRPAAVRRHPGHMRLLAGCSLVLAVSSQSREDLVGWWRWLGVRRVPEVLVVPWGADGLAARRTLPRPGVVRARRLAVALGTLDPRKGLDTVAEALQRVPAARRGPVVVVGRREPGRAPEVVAALRRARAAGVDVRVAGSLEDRAVVALLARARFTVFASRAEGHGLPVAESLWAGVPCLAASIPPVAETAQAGGCHLVAPGDVEAWAAALERAWADDAWIEELAAEARLRALPTWEQAADVTFRALRSVSELARR